MNLVIVENGCSEIYYNHWQGATLDQHLFWGPADARKFAHRMADYRGLMNEVWCEGAALIDYDRKILLWFGGQEVCWCVHDRKAHIELMTSQWPSWRLQWAVGSIAEIGAALGYDEQYFLVDEVFEPDIQIDDETDQDGELLLSWSTSVHIQVRRADVGHCDRALDVLRLGPAHMKAVLADLDNKQVQAPLSLDGNAPQCGVHIDWDANALAYWSAEPQCAVKTRLQKAWPGWNVTWLGDRLEAHLTMCAAQIAEPVVDWTVLKRNRLAVLRAHIEQARSFGGNDNADRKLAILDRLEKGLSD